MLIAIAGVTIIGHGLWLIVAAVARAITTGSSRLETPKSGATANPAARRSITCRQLTEMRDRINGLRSLLVERIAAGIEEDFSFIEREKGMFSFLGVNVEQIQTLINDYSIYLVNSSRINVASVNEANIDYLTSSLAKVLSS